MSKFNISLVASLILLLVMMMVSCDKKIQGYEVSGKLENVKDGYFYMTHELGDSIKIDTVKVNGEGEFSFKGEIDTITVMSLYFNKNTKGTYILANKGWKVEMKGDVLYPDLIEVKGGIVNDDLTSFKAKNKDLLKSRADILTKGKDDAAENDSLQIKDYVVELKNINFELSNVAMAYVKENPDKVASVMLLNSFFKDESSIPRLEEGLAQLKGRALDFPLSEELKFFSNKIKASAVGAYAPSFTLKNTKDKDVRLVDYRGKYLLLSFIATTCGVCVDEKKEAIEVYNQLKKQNKNIEFLSVVKDIEDKPISKGMQDSIKWNILPVTGGWSAKVFESFYIRAIPYHILISPSGTILERDQSLQSLIQRMDELPDNVVKKDNKKNKK